MSVARFCSVALVATAVGLTSGCSALYKILDNPSKLYRAGTLGTGGGYQSSQGQPSSSGSASMMPMQVMVARARMVFTYGFAAGGLWVSRADYAPGEWTRFELKGVQDGSGVIVERALLKVTDEGHEWWRVSWSPNAEDQKWVYEAQINPEQGQLVRLRGQGPNAGEPREVPVSRGTRIYHQPRRLTEASIQGALVGQETVQVAGRSITADHVEYGAGGGNASTIDWWLDDSLPGGVAKYQLHDDSGQAVWTATLLAYGENARSELGSF